MMTPEAIWLWMTRRVGVAAAQGTEGGAPADAPAQPPATPPRNGSAEQMADIHDIKPILDLGYDWLQLLYLAGGAILLAGLVALAWWLWKRRKKPEAPVSAPPPEAPDTEAYTALDALATETGLPPQQFYYRLSAILRHYIERRFDFPAAEMTTEELLPKVDRLALETGMANEFKIFCRKTDPIKFAGAPARQDHLAQDLAFSRDFVRTTSQIDENVEEVVETKAVGGVMNVE